MAALLIGYARCSTEQQDLTDSAKASSASALTHFGCTSPTD